MYFRHLYYDENNNVISLELECDICSNYIEIELPNDNITEAKDDYCVITNGSKILCKCGNYCQSGKITCKDTINTCKNALAAFSSRGKSMALLSLSDR